MNHLTQVAIYTDFQGLNRLRREARQESPEALHAVARQFEALFLQMVLRQMREARLADGLFDSHSTALYEGMYDQQIALTLATGTNGVGLAELLARQLSQSDAVRAATGGERNGSSLPLPPRTRMEVIGETFAPKAAATTERRGEAPAPFDSPHSFVRNLWPQAQAAARRLGTAPRALIAQAALETGWGRGVIRHPDGSSSHNLFNIKADRRWDGERVSTRTLEYRDGVAALERAQFRAYHSFRESFEDYVDFLQTNPRYAAALAHAGDPERFIRELHRAGYATDPDYTEKIRRIMRSDILNGSLTELKNGAASPIT